MTLIIDGDGHLVEDVQAIISHLPEVYRERAFGGHFPSGGMPPLDFFHSMPMQIFGASGEGTAEDWLHFLKETGVSKTVLYPTRALTYGHMLDVEWATIFCRAYNDWMYETYLSDPSGCFWGMALVPLQDPAAAAAELRRTYAKPGFVGAVLPANGVAIQPLGAGVYRPLYEAADELGAAIAVHTGTYANQGFDRMNIFASIHALGHPVGQLVSLSSMMMNGVTERYPNVRFGYLEAGVAWLYVLLERLGGSARAFHNMDVTSQLLSPANWDRVDDYLRELIADGRIFLGVEGEEPLLAQACKELGSKPFMYSSDYPHEVTVESCKETLEELLNDESLDIEAREGIVGANAQAFYAPGS